jgi:pantoate--beta-alanine ligase
MDLFRLRGQLEGLSRPHFFRGVSTVVAKLFNIIQPERAYFGQKDVQQTVVLKALVRDLHIPIDLRICPTVREHDGLALSSRNAYIDPSQRDDALILWHSLKAGLAIYNTQLPASAKVVLKAARDKMEHNIDNSQGQVSLEYLDIVHPETLQDLTDTDTAKGGILVGAIRLQGPDRTIRLIDNVILG